MDLRIKQVLPSLKNVTATSEDVRINLSFSEISKNIIPSTIQGVLDLNEQFNIERQESNKYRIVLQPEIITSLIGIKKNFNKSSDLFDGLTSDDNKDDFFSLKDIFDFHIICPDTLHYDDLTDSYNLRGKPILYSKDINVIKSGFYNNIYYEQQYQLICNDIIDLNEKFITSDNNRIILPITKLYLLITLKTDKFELIKELLDINNTIYSSGGLLTTNELNNNIFLGNYSFDEKNYEFTLNKEPIFNIKMNFSDISLNYTYNPYSEIIIRTFSDYIETGNIKTTDNIPYYAYIIKDGTNNFTPNKSESYLITDTNFYSGTTRLSISDPMTMLPRKLIFNTNTKFYEFYLDNELYDKNYFYFYLNDQLLNENEDYILSDYIKNKIILRFKPNISDILNIKYNNGENYIWRDLLDKGFIEPLTNNGVNYPFLNGINYIFTNIKKTIRSDKTNQITNDFYCKYEFKTSDDIINSNNDYLNNDGC